MPFIFLNFHWFYLKGREGAGEWRKGVMSLFINAPYPPNAHNIAGLAVPKPRAGKSIRFPDGWAWTQLLEPSLLLLKPHISRMVE